MPSQLFTLARSFKSNANGKIYISKIDTPPGEMTDPDNSVQVYLENEDGSHVPVDQPLIINAAGFPVYNGQIAKFVTVEGHAMAVYDAYNAQQFYYPNVLQYDPDQFKSQLLSTNQDLGSSLVMYNPQFPDSVSNILSEKLTLDLLTLTDYGFKEGNSGEDNLNAIIKAVNSITLPTKIIIPKGAFIVKPGIPVTDKVVVWEGMGGWASKLFASDNSSPMFNQTADLVEYSQFRNFGISGNDMVSGVNLTNANHCKIENLIIHNTVGSAITINGYCNDIIGNSLFTNAGNGISLGGVLNNVNVLRNRIYGNGAFGITTTANDPLAGLSLNIQFNDIEGNKFGGIRLYNIKSPTIDNNYFERNAELGYPYGDPESLLVRSDIHLMSSEGTLIANPSLGNKNVSIRSNQATPIGFGTSLPNMNSFVFSNYLNSVEITNNNILGENKYDRLLSIYRNRLSSKIVSPCMISRNTINTVGFIGSYDPITQNPDGAHFIEIDDISSGQNFIETGMLSWSVSTGTTGTLEKSTNKYNGDYSFIMNDGDRVYSTTIDLTRSPELKGKWLWFGAWVNDQNNASKILVGINGHYSDNNSLPVAGDGAWKFISSCVYIETTDTAVNAVMYKVGTGAALVNSPMLCILGTDPSKIPRRKTQQYNPSVPTTGFWDVDEIVIRKPMSVGQPKGWVVTVAGGPGVFNWISLGNL